MLVISIMFTEFIAFIITVGLIGVVVYFVMLKQRSSGSSSETDSSATTITTLPSTPVEQPIIPIVKPPYKGPSYDWMTNAQCSTVCRTCANNPANTLACSRCVYCKDKRGLSCDSTGCIE